MLTAQKSTLTEVFTAAALPAGSTLAPNAGVADHLQKQAGGRVRSPREVVELFYFKLWGERRLDLADDIFAEDGVSHQISSGPEVTLTRNPQAVKEHLTSWFEAFPDIKPQVERLVVEGDLVVSWAKMTGTHAGTWMGVPATQRSVVIALVATHRIVDGRIVEDWALTDGLGVLQQLGLVADTQSLLVASRSGPSPAIELS